MVQKSVGKGAGVGGKPPRIISENGDLFVVTRGDRQIALGLVARGGRRLSKLGYFFRIELYNNVGDAANLTLESGQSVWVAMFGHMHIFRGKWPIIGKLKGFSREDWPMPVFAHHHDGFNIDYIRTYDEDNLLQGLGSWRADQVPVLIDTSFVVEDGFAGAG